jgi:hypothetical protein
MLNEQKGRSCTYDASNRSARVDVRPGGGSPSEVSGSVLLDDAGGVVGVDLDPDGPARLVIMVGTHEAVARTRATRLSVSRDANGQVAHVVVHGIERPR